MRRTIYSSVKAFRALSPATRTNGAANGVSVNAAGYRVATAIIQTGTVTDGSIAVTIEDSASSGSGFAAVPAERRQGSLPTVADTDDDAIYEVGIIVDPLRPYLRVVATVSGATSGGLSSAVILLSGGNTVPVARP